MTERVVVITGASNGMGYEASRLFAQQGWQVFAGARRVDKIPKDSGITPLFLDVTDSASNQAFIQEILAQAGQIDVLINNAGYGEYGPVEEVPMDKIRAQFETNFFGAVELTQLVLPAMREKRSGRVIHISSIGGNIYTPLGAFYHATKAALQQFSDVLDMEVVALGIRSIVIQPGGTQSDWAEIALENAGHNLKPDSPYGPLVQQVSQLFRGNTAAGATSADLAKVFYAASVDKNPKWRYFNNLSDRALVRLARVHPKIFRGLISRLLKR